MDAAIEQAQAAASMDEVPVGAVIVFEEQVIARAHNRREADRDPIAHAEIEAIRQAAAHLSRWRLHGCTMVVTLEPCAMCAGAIVNARLDRVVYGANDLKAGAAGSVFDVLGEPRLNHQPEVVSGVHAEVCAGLLKAFFASRR